MNQKSFPHSLKLVFISLLAAVLVGCGGSNSDILGDNTGSAVHCVNQTSVTSTAISLTNSCSDTVIVLTDLDVRFVIAGGQSVDIPTSQINGQFAACFSPNEPQFQNTSVFTCGS